VRVECKHAARQVRQHVLGKIVRIAQHAASPPSRGALVRGGAHAGSRVTRIAGPVPAARHRRTDTGGPAILAVRELSA
jgi:hypothetical protein